MITNEKVKSSTCNNNFSQLKMDCFHALFFNHITATTTKNLEIEVLSSVQILLQYDIFFVEKIYHNLLHSPTKEIGLIAIKFKLTFTEKNLKTKKHSKI